jgi:glycosyl transferase family 2
MSDLEVIVVDDGSTDGTRETCASADDRRLHYVYQHNDGTFGVGARNHAMLLARGDWVALLDQDDRWAPDKLQRQLAAVADRSDIGAVFCRARLIGSGGEVQGEQAAPLPAGDVFHLLLSANRYYASTGIFRRALIPRMGLPHESVAIGDWYLWVSVARHAQVAVVDELLADYRLHDAGFQIAQRSSDLFRFWSDHWAFVQAISPRMHPGCLVCRQQLRELRRQIADQQTQAVRRALRRGDFSSGTVQALRCAWQAEPDGLIAPRAWRNVSRLARAAIAGAWTHAWSHT